MVRPFQWTCPFCSRPQVVTEENFQSQFSYLDIGKSKYDDTGVTLVAARCVNTQCNEVYISLEFDTAILRNGNFVAGTTLQRWRLRPESSSIVQPDYIPAPLLEDYYEACLIRDKSPKAAATLARRCLQGMIRDFCNISRSRLIDEITELRKLLNEDRAPRGVEAETIEAIDAVRGVGNIGAHMEKDINLIIEVEPGEAQALIELIEMLFDEWYVARYKRQQRLENVKKVAVEKNTQIEIGRAAIAEQKKLAAPSDPSAEPA